MLLPPGDGGCRMLELEVIPEHGLTSEQIEFLLGKYYVLEQFLQRFLKY